MNNPEAKTGEIMPKEAVVTEERKKIISVTRGWVTDDKLAILRDQVKGITVSTPHGYKECVKAIAVVRKYRTTLEKSRLEKNKGDHEKIALRNKEAKRITAVLLEIETPLKDMKQAKDELDAKEKAEKERAEKERVDAIKQRMEDNFGQHQIDGLAGNSSKYMEARKRIIEAYDIDDAYQEFKHEAVRLQRELLARINNIFLAKRDQEEAEKQLQLEKAKLDAEKQKMADQEKRLQEQQEEFEKERAAWHAKRKAKEAAEKEAEAEACQADKEDPDQEPSAGCAEAQEEVQVEGPPLTESQIYGETEVEVSESHREELLELIQEETGIQEFSDEDLSVLLYLAQGMFLSEKISNPIRYLADLVKKENEAFACTKPMDITGAETDERIQY